MKVTYSLLEFICTDLGREVNTEYDVRCVFDIKIPSNLAAAVISRLVTPLIAANPRGLDVNTDESVRIDQSNLICVYILIPSNNSREVCRVDAIAPRYLDRYRYSRYITLGIDVRSVCTYENGLGVLICTKILGFRTNLHVVYARHG